MLKHRNLKILQQQPTTPADDSRGIAYAYKASLIGAAQQFELTDDGLSFRFAGRSGLWRYKDIAAIRLSYRPVSMQSRRFRADIQHVDGGRLVILSTSWQTAALFGWQIGGFIRRNRPVSYKFDNIPEALLP